MERKIYLAVDLGAGSGRVIAGIVEGDKFILDVLHRFPNNTSIVDGHERWSMKDLFNEICIGLKTAGKKYDSKEIISIGVDTWAVDYGLLSIDGKLLEEPVCYRDSRTNNIEKKVFNLLSQNEIYRRTGIQFLPFNTIFQLFAQTSADEIPAGAHKFLMIPDLLNFFLTGVKKCEFTNATSTQLYHSKYQSWDKGLFEALGLKSSLMPDVVIAGSEIGPLKSEFQKDFSLHGVKIVAPATHDTGSAIAGTPLEDNWSYISSGTWSLVGIETEETIITEEALSGNFTNEGGVFGTNRFLKNVMGLWILESCRKIWESEGILLGYDILSNKMPDCTEFLCTFFPDDMRFLNPENMIEELNSYFSETGQAEVRDQVQLSLIILETMAFRYASVISSIEKVTGVEICGVRIMGGGCQNDFLNQATANATGLTVKTGPIEATASGNILVQAIADKHFANLKEARKFLENNTETNEFLPRDHEKWQAAFENYLKYESQ